MVPTTVAIMAVVERPSFFEGALGLGEGDEVARSFVALVWEVVEVVGSEETRSFVVASILDVPRAKHATAIVEPLLKTYDPGWGMKSALACNMSDL
jgi:hypothetical protein